MVEQPTRVQLSRAKGWRMPADTVKVDRTTKWGNPWRLMEVMHTPMLTMWWVTGPRSDEECTSEAEATGLMMRKFRFWAEGRPDLIALLRGKNLACWCKPGAPCHADVLLELANAPTEAPDHG